MRSPSGRFIDWAEVVKAARRAPGWVLVLPDSAYSLVKHIRLRRHPDLRLEDGYLAVRIRNVYEQDGKQRGDIDVRFVAADQTGVTPHDSEV